MKATIKEVARLANVSVATVSNVLNQTKRVSPETVKRVEDAVKKLNYQINPLARNFRKGESKLIGFVVCDLSNYFFQDIALGLEKRLSRYGYRPILIDSKENKLTEIENVRNLLAGSIDAFIIAPTTEDCSYLKLMLEQNPVPVVFVDRKPVGYESDLVLSSNEQGGYDAVMHLISRGHKDIAFIGSRFDSTMVERAAGYKRALVESGIPVNANYIRYGEGLSLPHKELRYGSIYQHTLDLVTNYPVTALFVGNNMATIGAYSCLKEHKIRVPEDLAFITFDDSFWLTLTTPAISAIAQQPEKIGDLAGKMVYQRLCDVKNKVNRESQLVRIDTMLVARTSSM